MKTYSRKKLGDNEQEIIIDLNDVCRLCMNKEDELISIYNNDDSIPLTLRIMACVALEVIKYIGYFKLVGKTDTDKIILQ